MYKTECLGDATISFSDHIKMSGLNNFSQKKQYRYKWKIGKGKRLEEKAWIL